MAEVNESSREITAKIVYCGPGLSGKTTNLRGIHKALDPVDRGQMTQADTEGERTLFFDMLPLTGVPKLFGYGVRYQVLTVPGQIYYAAARRLVMRNADGLVFVADSSADRLDATVESMYDIHSIMKTLGLDAAKIPVVLQFNKRDVPGALPVALLEGALNYSGWPMYQCIASRGVGVMECLSDIMQRVHTSLRDTRL